MQRELSRKTVTLWLKFESAQHSHHHPFLATPPWRSFLFLQFFEMNFDFPRHQLDHKLTKEVKFLTSHKLAKQVFVNTQRDNGLEKVCSFILGNTNKMYDYNVCLFGTIKLNGIKPPVSILFYIYFIHIF